MSQTPDFPQCPLEQWIQSHTCWQHLKAFSIPNSTVDYAPSNITRLVRPTHLILLGTVFKQELGSLRELASRTSCDVCFQIHQILKEIPIRPMETEIEDQIACSITRRSSGWFWEIHNPLTEVVESVRLHWYPIGEFCHGARLLEGPWIDFENILRCRTTCVKNHTECQENPGLLQTHDGLRIVDVATMSITDMAHCDTYLALSYVWGSTRGLNLQKQNLADLLMPRSLNHHWPQIPRTIRDAIILTAKLGFRYLWVDALCIVQNDKEGKMRDIERMAAIYCKAQFTIVAAGGNNADHGLTGAGESPRSLCHQIIIHFSPSAEFIIYPSQTLDESATKYFQRAWTFQEYRLPNRLLVFFNGTASWKCRRLECSEGLMGPRQMLHLPRNGLKSDSTWPNFTQYTDLVAAYNGRELSYEGDSLSAFSGVLEAIQHQFPSRFIQALPEFYFDLALLWQPRKPLRRRPSYLDFATPSWSWIGWSGSLDMRYCEHGFEYPILTFHSDYSTSWSAMCHPVTDWYKTTGPFDKRYPVNNGYIMYHKLRVGRVDNSPNQDELKETQFVPSDITETGWHVSKHFEKWPKGRSEAQLCYRSPLISEAFSYPLPLGQGPKMVQSQKMTYLHFSSHRAWLFVTESSVKAVSSRITCVTVSIADASGQLVGVMRLNSTDTPNFGETPCELVVISRSAADLDLFHDRAPLEEASDTVYLMQIITFRRMRLPLGTTPDDYRALQKIVGIYEYYNVLWIEWENGIAYRKALGRICKEAWEAQDPEKIDVLLG